VGTVGKVLPHTQVKIDAGGQILVKGNNVFMGYLSVRSPVHCVPAHA
jgi:long-subunit acyl-CoA synthetase (AMP-forming)